jgi:spore germination protein GerM
LSVRRTLRALVDAPRGGFTTGTRSAILDAGLVSDRGASGGVARVDLAAEFSELSPNDQILALAQVVCTLTSLPGIGQVRFTQDGAPVEVLRGDNSLADEPVSRADYQRLLPAP